jgi:peptide/nickel transport system substrate-binding protein
LLANPAASGSFKLRRVETGNLWEFERRAEDWHMGGGNLAGAIWKFVRETTSQRLALQRGEVHIACDLTSEDMDALKGKPGIVEIIEPEYRTFSIKMNTENGPLKDVNLRRAISCAYNYQGMRDAAGYGKLMTGPLPDGIFGQNPKLEVYRTDPAKAKEYLAKAKRPEGRIKLTAAYVAGLESERRYLLVLLDSLRTLNIDLDIKAMGWTDMVASARSPQTMADFFCVYQTANYGDPDNIAFATYHSSRNGGWQNPVYHNPEVDKLIEAGRSETDPAKRAAIYEKFQEVVVTDAPDIFGVLESRKLAMRSDVKNYHFTPVAANAIDLFPLSL